MTNNDVRLKGTKPLAIAVAASMLLVAAGAASAAPAAPAGSRLAPSVTTPAEATPVSAPIAPARTSPAETSPAEKGPLTNTAHLDFLMATVPLTPVAGHTTYKLDEIPSAQAPWTYADKKADGSYGRVGGGNLDPATGHWTQGAYNADDIARTAVVDLRHWKCASFR